LMPPFGVLGCASWCVWVAAGPRPETDRLMASTI
jgi:hypothetical protein